MKPEDIGQLLRELRIQNGYTQRQLAEVLFLTHQAVSRWENGQSIPDVDMLRKLAELYQVSVDELLQGTLEEEPDPFIQTLIQVGRYLIVYVGLIGGFMGLSLFFNYNEHFSIHLIWAGMGLALSSVLMFVLKHNRLLLEYFVITGILIIATIITVIPKQEYYGNNLESFYIIQNQQELDLYRELDYFTHVITHSEGLQQSVFIYNEEQPNIEYIPLVEYQPGDHQTIFTDSRPVTFVESYYDTIYYGTYDVDTSDDFRMYELDTTTLESEMVFQSDHVYNMYILHDKAYLISNPLHEDTTEIYEFTEQGLITFLYNVSFGVSGLHNVIVNDQTMALASIITDDNPGFEHDLVLVDNNEFIIDDVVLENLSEPYLFFGDTSTVFVKNYDFLYKYHEGTISTVNWDEEYAIFDRINNNRYRIGEFIVDEEFNILYDFMFYSEDYRREGTRLVAMFDSVEGYYAIDNEYFGFVIEMPPVENTWFLEVSTRYVLLGIGVLTLGGFIVIGQQRKTTQKGQ